VGDFGCGTALNGTLYQVTATAAGQWTLTVDNIDCSTASTQMGDMLTVSLFSSTAPDMGMPCDPAVQNSLFCMPTSTGLTINQPNMVADSAGQIFYVALFGSMSLTDTAAAACAYNVQTSGPAVEIELNLPSETFEILLGDTVQLTGISGADSYQWTVEPNVGTANPANDPNPTLTPVTDGNELPFMLTAQVGDCEVTGTVFVTVSPSIVPGTVITPNGDGINDFWYIVNLDDINTYPTADVQIYNRWGQRVFRSIGYGAGKYWDGTRNGKLLPVGPYYYIIDVNDDDSDIEPISGAVSIIY